MSGGASPGAAWDRVLAGIDPGAAGRLAERFGGRPGSARFVRASANLVMRFETWAGTAYLRVVTRAQRSPGELARAQHFLAHLAERGAPVCRPLRTREGALVACRDDLAATAVEAVPGRTLDRNERSPRVFESWGRALGALHRAARDYAPPAEPPPLRGLELWAQVASRLRSEAEPVRRAVEEVDRWLATLPDEGVGMTHGDDNASNVLYESGEARIVDFDEPQVHWLATDVARPLREMRHLEARLVRELHAAFLAGYRSRMPLSPAMEAAIPGFVRMKDLEVLGWLVSGGWAGSTIPGGADLQEELRTLRRVVVGPLQGE